MNLSIEGDRLAHRLMRGDGHAGYDEARHRLDRAALVLTADGAAGLPWGQAALLTAAECGVRMFPGGVSARISPTRPWSDNSADGLSDGISNSPAAEPRTLPDMRSRFTSAPIAGACRTARCAGPASSASRRRLTRPAPVTRSAA
ncbi:hypothetical protein QIH87_47685 [Bradyrhizobium elkanii]|uniref:hypothetical protein n=1 Tax=Bradyrhizobium elkanii TaxID=29448 RepID=UPI002714E186|nr:hypothetical protein [Bradyrhizobium elkanii]WLB09528.1 hypothetical protein QIH87_47685 [Bradyrhizobium elkanii]WLB72524.1 hypothetical protein QIH89_00635 [Bradyrhizobium elkanii]